MNHPAGGPTSLAQRLRSHSGAWRLALAAAIGTTIGLVAQAVKPATAHWLEPVLWGWCGFNALALLMAGSVVLRSHERLRGVAHEDPSSLVLLLLVVGGCVFSLGAVGAMLVDLKSRPGADRLSAGLLATATVVLSWLLIHTRFAFHYAHRYVSGRRHEGAVPLQFPGDTAPDYGDFLYFSFVIGMTSQVSDVQVTTRWMRRLVLWHSLLSFAFNLLILALGINAIASAL